MGSIKQRQLDEIQEALHSPRQFGCATSVLNRRCSRTDELKREMMYMGKSKRLWVLRWFLEEKVLNVLSKGECVDRKRKKIALLCGVNVWGNGS